MRTFLCFFLYCSCIQVLNQSPETALEKIREDLTFSDLQELRRKNVSPDDILTGFPTWERLKELNKEKIGYHDSPQPSEIEDDDVCY